MEAFKGGGAMKLLLADDHAMFRTAVADGLEALIGSGTEVLEADSYETTQTLLAGTPGIDVVLLDLLMPGFANFEGLAALVRDFPAVPIVVLSGSGQSRYQVEAVRRGARGYIVKNQPLSVLAQIVQIVRDGGTYVSTSVLDSAPQLAEAAAEAPTPLPARESPPAGAEESATRLSRLTDRELQILTCLARGASNKQIARDLGITDTTVKVHLRMIFKKLGVSNRTQAAFFARERGAAHA
jgi:two-component system nitrate/nitrite response regulator NarL